MTRREIALGALHVWYPAVSPTIREIWLAACRWQNEQAVARAEYRMKALGDSLIQMVEEIRALAPEELK